MAQSQTPITPAQKTMRKFEQGRYTATDVRWGMTLDLSGADNRSLIAYGFHGRENQQARASRSFLSFRGSSTVQEEADRFALPPIDPTRPPGPAHVVARSYSTILQIYLTPPSRSRSRSRTSYCSGSSILVVQVSSSAAPSGTTRSSLFGT